MAHGARLQVPIRSSQPFAIEILIVEAGIIVVEIAQAYELRIPMERGRLVRIDQVQEWIDRTPTNSSGSVGA
ncbi:hypothetical protein KC356_g286 [Hortaea werneckii]|nr:hypothetical protein KC356_g286 [Hortaea werneckii]